MDKSDIFTSELAVLKEITGAIASAANINTVANIILDLSISYTNAEKGSLMLVNEKGELHILASRGINVAFSRTYKVAIGEGIVGRVAQNREPVLVEDIGQDSRFGDTGRDRYKTRSFISCPILGKGRLLGVININDKKDDTPFSENEFSLMKIIADQAAIALDNASVIRMENLTYLSHELRTPLNSIKGAVYHLEQSGADSPPEHKEFRSIISEETEKLISIVDNLLDFLRKEDETKVMKKTLVNLRLILAEVVKSKMLKSVLVRKDLDIVTELPKKICDVVGDRVRVVQLFLNLLEGLSHYLEQGDTVRITLRENDHVEVSLHIPERIPEASLPFLFHSGYIFQSDPEERVKLYLARKVAEGHRWQLNAKSEEKGIVISLVIPKSAKEATDAVVTMTTDIFTEFIADLMGLNICSLMLKDELSGDLTIESSRGLEDDIVKRTRIRVGDSIAGWVALQGKPLLIENIEQDPRFGKINIPHYNTHSLLSVPLKVDNEVIGVLNLNNKASAEAFTPRDLEIASALGERVSRYIAKVKRGQYSEEEFRKLVTSLHDLVEAEKSFGKKKPLLADLAARMMEELGADEEEKNLAIYISMIYDLGLVMVDEHILNKKTELTSAESRTLKVHPQTTVNLLGQFEFSEDVLIAILHHHERYDGTGFPDSLEGGQIPLLSRVLAVVDAFTAMLEERPYRKARSRKEALEEIRVRAGTHYDPEVVDALGKVVQGQ
jgi:HD-GYP domain-containing protein (c-di-GMP phosphodiesterase class II)